MESTAEREFRAKYPFARFTRETVIGTISRFAVYAGDYLCAEALSRREAFERALVFEQLGYITPDPNEQSMGA